MRGCDMQKLRITQACSSVDFLQLNSGAASATIFAIETEPAY